MISLLDCIKRVPQRMEWIITHREEAFQNMEKRFGKAVKTWNELVLIGCGTSNTAAVTVRYIAQSLAGVRITPVLPGEFLHEQAVRNTNALYVFISQTGTSVLTRKALAEAKRLGYATLAVSESPYTPVAKEADGYWPMGCGVEEYPMRTIGYSTSVLSLAMLAVWVGLSNYSLCSEESERFLSEAMDAAGQIASTIEKTLQWMEKERRQLFRSDCLVFTGTGPLFGVAMEAAVKMWEVPQMMTFSFELEEGLHGPNYGYTQRHCVIVLDDGGYDSDKARSLAAYMKNEKQNGYLIGVGTLDEHDLRVDCTGRMNVLVFASVVQTMAYHLALMQGRDLFAPHDNRTMYSYFDTHNELNTYSL